MKTEEAGLGAAVVVLGAVLGLAVLIGVILLMMLVTPGIRHSPSEHGRLAAPSAVVQANAERGVAGAGSVA